MKIKQLLSKIYFLKIILRFMFSFFFKITVCKAKKKYGKCIFIMATPCHGNLGDHAIVYAEHNMLKNMGFINFTVEISNRHYLKYKDIIRQYVNDNDLIIIDGGGNLGTLWPWEDDKISEIVDTYKNNSIIIFPQTCYYEDSISANQRKEKNRRIYETADKLCIFLRDESSYEFFKMNFPEVKCYYVPDIVMSLADIDITENRKNALLCLREDTEKIVSEKFKNKIEKYLKQKNINYSLTSTVVNKSVNKYNRSKELYKKWKEFSSAKFIITDRLHGMIFCAVTQTPCIAFDNISHKVKEGYKWLSHLSYIRFCEEYDDATRNIDIFLSADTVYKYNIDYMKPYYNTVMNEVRNAFYK